ncbi:MAG: PAC2 family protein [Acidimicrobiales bacterium]
MTALQWETQPKLNQPVIVAAFQGWTDAGGAASSAATFLAEQWGAREFATVDPEDFFDFTALRPQVRLRDDQSREIVWPENKFLAATIPGSHDVIFLIGVEPHTRWRAFCEAVTTVATTLEARSFITLGAMLTDVTHTRSSPVRGSSVDGKLADRYGLARPRYEGPTGIVGVLQDAFARVDIPAASLMAQVPHYVPRIPSPKATLALVERVCDLLETSVGTGSLEQASDAYEREVSEFVASDEDIAGYVYQLERRAQEVEPEVELSDLPSGDTIAAELEQFLREQGGAN